MVGLGDADAVTDAVGTASVVGSAKALVAGAPTSAAATSRVPARRSRAPRGVVGVDIGAFLSGSRRDARTTGSPGHSGSVPHSSTVLWSRSHLSGIPTCRDMTSRPTAAGQCRTWTGFPRTGACGCRPKATARLYSPRRVGSVRVSAGFRTGARTGQNGGGSWSWGRAGRRVRRQGQCSWRRCRCRCGVGGVGLEEGDASDGLDLGAVSAVLVAPGGDRGEGVAWWGCGVVFEVELECAVGSVGEHGAGPAGAVGRCRLRGARSTSGRTLVCRALAGWVVRTRPVGSVQVAMPSGVRVRLPAQSLFDPVVAPAQAEQVGVWVGPWGQGVTWSMSQKTAEMVQPGKRQRRSRVLIRVAIRFVGRYGPARSASTAAADRWLAPVSSRTRATVVDGGGSPGPAGLGGPGGCCVIDAPCGASVFVAVSSSRAPVVGWQGATCTAFLPVVVACSMVVVSQLRAT